MPINIPNNLPARRILEKECIKVMDENRSSHQDIRPLEIAILNLMPLKTKTETQWARLLGNTSLQINLTLLTTGRAPKNACPIHMQTFYKRLQDVKEKRFDGMIITGAPVEMLPFEQVEYWNELCQIFEWSNNNVHSMFTVCWGAQAALKHFHGIEKYELPEKMMGVYSFETVTREPLLTRGFDDEYLMPMARSTEVPASHIMRNPDLEILSFSEEAGVGYVRDLSANRVYMFNHLEYDALTIKDEYERDLEQGGYKVSLPYNYFPGDDPTREPKNRWRSHAFLLISNWLDEVYQGTPYDINQIGVKPLIPDHMMEQGQGIQSSVVPGHFKKTA